MERTFDVVVTEDEDGMFVATVPALRGCVTQGETKAEALENIKEAIVLCLETGEEPDAFVRSVSVASVSVEA
ncbi:MAG: type II toxin-antitoxin system HicB family antitoxin [Thermoplasmatota archaeon]